jgi:hypothetical protein
MGPEIKSVIKHCKLLITNGKIQVLGNKKAGQLVRLMFNTAAKEIFCFLVDEVNVAALHCS